MQGTKTIVINDDRKPERVWFSRVWLADYSPYEKPDYDYETKTYTPPCVVEIAKGHYVVVDGHHRIKRMVDRNRKAAMMWVIRAGDILTYDKDTGTGVPWLVRDCCSCYGGSNALLVTVEGCLQLTRRLISYADKYRRTSDGTNTKWPL
jgi:hypothetical protein